MSNPMHTSWTAKARDTFLFALRAGDTVSDAARSVGLARETAYRLRRRNPRFARAWDLALQVAREERQEIVAAVRRPNEPFMRERAVVYRGEIVGYRQTLDATALLRAVARLDKADVQNLARVTVSNMRARKPAEDRNSAGPLV